MREGLVSNQHFGGGDYSTVYVRELDDREYPSRRQEVSPSKFSMRERTLTPLLQDEVLYTCLLYTSDAADE